MVTQLKNVLVVDGTGWFPYWGDILIEDDTIKDIISGENIIIREEKNFDRTVNFKRGEKPGAYAFVAVGDGPFTKADYEKLVDDIMNPLCGMRFRSQRLIRRRASRPPSRASPRQGRRPKCARRPPRSTLRASG